MPHERNKNYLWVIESLLLGVLALAMAWASKTAARLIGTKKNPRKSHGYYAKSWFRIGFDHLRHMLRTTPKTHLPAGTL